MGAAIGSGVAVSSWHGAPSPVATLPTEQPRVRGEDRPLAHDAVAAMKAADLRRPWSSAVFVGLAVLVLVCGTSATYGHDPDAFDVVVVGAGPGGIGAALQAAGMGSKVALLSETDWVGGQITSAAAGTMDEGGIEPRQYGVYGDFVRRVTAAYDSRRQSVHTCYGSKRGVCVEPSLAQRVLRQMVDRASGITLFTSTKVTSVAKSKQTVSGVET